MEAEEFKEYAEIRGSLPEKDSSDICLIVGGGPSVWSDYEKLTNQLKNPYKVLAVNAVGMFSPQLDYWFSLHCDKLVTWEVCRKLNQYTKELYKKPILISLQPKGQYAQLGDIDHCVSIGDPTVKLSAKHSGSLEDSGFFSMCLAVAMGFNKVYLVGMPADDSGHIFVPHWNYLQHDKKAIKQAWINTLDKYPILKRKVRSTSGLTKKLLGEKF